MLSMDFSVLTRRLSRVKSSIEQRGRAISVRQYENCRIKLSVKHFGALTRTSFDGKNIDVSRLVACQRRLTIFNSST